MIVYVKLVSDVSNSSFLLGYDTFGEKRNVTIYEFFPRKQLIIIRGYYLVSSYLQARSSFYYLHKVPKDLLIC